MCIVNHCFAGIVAVLVPSPKPYITLTKTLRTEKISKH